MAVDPEPQPEWIGGEDPLESWDPHRFTGNSSKDIPSKDPNATSPPGDVTTAYGTTTIETPPEKPKPGDVGGQGNTKVDSKAIHKFGENVKLLVAPLKTSYDEVTNMAKIAPGTFPSAVALGAKTVTLKEETGTSLNNIISALTDLGDAMQKIAADYSSTAEANKMTADQFTKYMTTANSSITAAGTPGTSTK
jgi:hypothetical protein